jgi:hypothetical protein
MHRQCLCTLSVLVAAAGRVLAQPCTPEWSTLGSGMNDWVLSLAVLPSGDLVAGGYFTAAGSVEANRIARWNGWTWSALGSGMNGLNVAALATVTDGDLVAGGSFSTAGGEPANNIARWNGSAWAPLDSGVNGSVRSLAVLPSGDLVAGGYFTSAGGVTANHIARWTGLSWLPLKSGVGLPGSSVVRSMAVLSSGDLAAGGQFIMAGSTSAGQHRPVVWVELASFGAGLSAGVYSLAVMPGDELVAGGSFSYIYGGTPVTFIAWWNESTGKWMPLGSGMNSTVYALAVLPTGDLVAGGGFDFAGGVSASRIARWNGATWSALGSGMDAGSLSPFVYAVTVLPNGDLVAGGLFTSAGGVPASHIARWACSALACKADCDQSGTLSIDDFICFQTLYVLLDPPADCDANGQLNIDDFVCFQTHFALGC